MSFGLSNAPVTFEGLMDLVLRGQIWKTCLVYLVIVKNFKDHLENLKDNRLYVGHYQIVNDFERSRFSAELMLTQITCNFH